MWNRHFGSIISILFSKIMILIHLLRIHTFKLFNNFIKQRNWNGDKSRDHIVLMWQTKSIPRNCLNSTLFIIYSLRITDKKMNAVSLVKLGSKVTAFLHPLDQYVAPKFNSSELSWNSLRMDYVLVMRDYLILFAWRNCIL